MDMSKFADWESPTITPGKKYGRLTILSTYYKIGTYRYYALCRCDCGTDSFLKRIDHIMGRENVGCGCTQREAVTKHGKWGHPLFRVWTAMNSRCYNKKDNRYANYGGRGITVCDKWKDINQFITDMEFTYRKGLQIERTDNNKGYSPDNCKWATQTEQARNKSSNIKLSHDGKTLCLSEWSQITGLSYGTLWERVKILGWNTERALTTPALSAKARCLIARNTYRGKS